MKRITLIVIAMLALGMASAQQAYDYTQRQFYEFQLPPTFVVDGLRYHVLTDSTVEVFRIENYTYPGTHTVEVPPTVQDSNGVMYRVTRIAGSGKDDFLLMYWHKDTLYYMDTIYLPEGLEEIGRNAFRITPNLRRCNIPTTVRVIEDYAFSQCDIGSTIELPENVELGYNVFLYSDIDSFITYSTGREPRICTVDGNIYSADTTRLIYMLPITVDTLTLLPTVRRIESCALREVVAQTVILPEGLREIGELAFNSALQGLYVPASVCRIEGPLIEGIVPSSFQLTVDPASTHYRFGDNMLTSYDGDTLVMVIGNWTDNKTLPEGIKVVGQYAFCRQTQLYGMTFPEGVVEIGPYAFYASGCYRLQFPSTLERIGEQAFAFIVAGDLGEDGKLFLPSSLRDIGRYAFAHTRCQRLKLPDSLTYVPEGAFWGFKADVVFMGSSIEHIYPFAFGYQTYSPDYPILEDTVLMPDNTTRFSYAMPSTLKTVGYRAFLGRTFSMPVAGLRFDGTPDTIGEKAFYHSHIVTFGDTVPPVVYDKAFGHADTVNVPCGGAASFAATPGWGNAFTYVESPCPPPTAVEEPDGDGIGMTVSGRRLVVTGADSQLDVEVFDMMGRRVATAIAADPVLLPSGGVYLVRLAGHPARKVVVL